MLDFAGSSFLLLLGLLTLLVVGVFGVIYKIFDGKYPKIKFIVIDGKYKREVYRRLAGNMIVPDNLLFIMLNEKKLMGDNISEYDYVFEKGKKVYIAFEKSGVLIPAKIKGENIQAEDYLFAQDITIRYINTRESAKEYVEKSNPLFATIINVLPYAILMSIFVLGLYFTVNSLIPPITDSLTKVSENIATTSQYLNETSSRMGDILAKINNTQQTPYNFTSNSTYDQIFVR